MKEKTAVICLSRINGGMELASVKLARLLSSEVNVEFIARNKSFIAQKKEHFEGYPIQLHVVDFSSNLSLKLIWQVRQILIHNHIKNVIFLGASEMKSLYFATIGLDINFIVRQGTTKSTPKKDIFHKLFYSKVNYFIGNSEYIKQNILKILPIPTQAQVKRIYASVELEKDLKVKTANTPLNILHVGRITQGKGQLEAIEACEILYKNHIDFTLNFLGTVHDNSYYKKIQDRLETLPFKNKIHFIGFANVKEYLVQSDIFLFPTYGEGMSNAIIEALSSGLITIVYNNTSTPEFKELGFHIHLTQKNNVENLKEILLYVIQNLNNEKISSAQNHQLALKVFAQKKEKNEYMKLLI